MELNTVKCDDLSVDGFLANHDLNITASYFKVDVTKDSLFTVHASTAYWHFIFEEYENRNIQPINTFGYDEYGGATCIRLAFNTFQMKQFEFSLGGIDPTKVLLATRKKKSWTR